MTIIYDGDEPKYPELRAAIQGYYNATLPPLAALRKACFSALDVPDPTKAEAEEPFDYTTLARETIDEAVEIFLTEMAGPNRTRIGFVDTQDEDGILQEQSRLAHEIGLARGVELMGAEEGLEAARNSPAVRQMLNHAFDRLSENGRLVLEDVRDEIHGILVGAQAEGLNPIETGRQLAAQFDEYKGWQFQRLARTEAAFASEEGVRNQLRELGVEQVEILVSAGACEDICQPYDGLAVDINDEANLPPFHPNCVCSVNPIVPEEE